MEKLVILGGAKLSGEVEISGAKNSAVAILAASIMVKGKCRIDNVPHVSDIDVLLDIINGLGGAVCEVAAEQGNTIVKRIGIQDQFGQSAPYERLLEMNGITVENIVNTAKTLM